MRFIFKIARRYLIGKKSTNAIHILSFISLIAMIVGTMALILVLSVYNGFENLVLTLYDSFRPDLVIQVDKGKTFEPQLELIDLLNDNEGISAFSLVLEENALFEYDDHQHQALIKGVDGNYPNVNPIDTCLVDGYYRIDRGKNTGVVGLGVAKELSLSLFDDFNDFKVYMPRKNAKVGSANPLNLVKSRIIKPMGFYSIEKEFDSKYVFVDLYFAQDLMESPNQVSSIEILLAEGASLNSVQEQLSKNLANGLYIENRYEVDKTLYKVMQSEKFVAFLILSFILLLMSFNIIGCLTMLVLDKKKDISILRTMGATTKQIYRIFLTTGLTLSCVGAFIGCILALSIGLLQQKFKLLKINENGNFLIDAFPVEFRLIDFILVAGIVILIGLMASYIPAKRAAQQSLMFRE